MQKIEPSVSVEMWTSKPDAAEALMNSDSEAAYDYMPAGWIVAGGILATLAANLAIRGASGPFSGILDLVMQCFVNRQNPGPPSPPSPPPESPGREP